MKRKKIWRWIGASFLTVFVALSAMALASREPVPVVLPEINADSLALKMSEAVGKDQWDSLGWVSWKFAGIHQLLWDKKRNLVRVQYGKTEVILDAYTQTGKAFRKGEELTGKKGMLP